MFTNGDEALCCSVFSHNIFVVCSFIIALLKENEILFD